MAGGGPAAARLVPAGPDLWLYRYELQLVSRWTATRPAGPAADRDDPALVPGLPAADGGALAAPTLPGRVLVAVDRSDSMDVADPQRPPVEKLRLARALKLAGDLCSDLQLAEWIQQYEQKNDGPVWVAADEYPDDPARRRQLADSRQPTTRPGVRTSGHLDAQPGGRQQLLAGEGGQLLQALADKHQVELFGFAQEAREVKPPERNRMPSRCSSSSFNPRRSHSDRHRRPGRGVARPSPTCTSLWPAPWRAPVRTRARSWASCC